MRRYVEYRESQRFDLWVYLLIGAIGVGGLAMAFVQIGLGRPVGDRPVSNFALLAIVLPISVGFPVMFALMRLDIETKADGVWVRFWPFLNRTLLYSDIRSAQSVVYSPITEYGGWGIRGWGKRVAYNARGNQGVLVTMTNGATVLLGSQKPDELEAAIRGSRPPL